VAPSAPPQVCRTAHSPSRTRVRASQRLQGVRGVDGETFAAPTMIVHHAAARGYCPPPRFRAAVLRTATVAKLYNASVRVQGTDGPSRRLSVLAESLDEARNELEADYSKPTWEVFDLHNAEDAPRLP
jgi:hypothetical protein